MNRWARGALSDAVREFLSEQDDTVRFTAYQIGKQIKAHPTSVAYALRRLAAEGQVTVYGLSPFIVGRVREGG